jgi:hypothetical protein
MPWLASCIIMANLGIFLISDIDCTNPINLSSIPFPFLNQINPITSFSDRAIINKKREQRLAE